MLPRIAAPGSAFAPPPLDILSATTTPGGADSRYLGVALDWVHLSPLTAAPLSTPMQAACLTWALALLATVVWLLPLPLRWWGWRAIVVLAVALAVIGHVRVAPAPVAERLSVIFWWLLPATAALLAWRAGRLGLALWCGALSLGHHVFDRL